MKKTVYILAIIFWIVCLVLLVLAVTDIYPSGKLKDYRIVIGIAFLGSLIILRILNSGQKE